MKFKLFLISFIPCYFFNVALFGQQVKKPEAGIFLLKNATLHTVSNGNFTGDLLIKDGTIASIDKNIGAIENAQIINCSGKHVYPGFIDSGSRLGLVEIDAVSVTNDFNELGDFIPHMKALTAINPNAVAIPVTRVNGITTVFAKPDGSTFPGTGALIDLFGYSPEQMSCGSERVLMRFPSTGKRGRWDKRSDEDIKKDAEKALNKINEIWDNAVQYYKIDSASKTENKYWFPNNPQMSALLPVVKREQPLFIEVNSKHDIETALTWISTKNIPAVFTGVAEGWRVADQIAKANIPVIVGPVLSIPRREYDRYDVPYTNAAKMFHAGVKVALRTDNAENTRNLPFHAAFAAAYGLGIENALRSVTLTPAEIFGVSEKYGSLDKGKIANLFICDGDPFETKTKIEALFIRGWKVPLESRQTLLNDEFLRRATGVK